MPPPDPYLNRREQMFPRLTEAQIERMAAHGQRRAVAAGELLFEYGEKDVGMFLVLEGTLEIARPTGAIEERIIVLGHGEFTGEMSLLSSQRALARARMLEAGSVVAIKREQLREIIQRDSELSELLMRAFILRRVALISLGGGGLVLLGSRHSASTLYLKEFLTRNGQPFTYEEIESDPGAQSLLDRFHVGIKEVPVVVCEGGKILRNPTIESLASSLGLSLELDQGATRDVVIVGAGPAGLAAAVYAASEGLDVLVLEDTAPGGQAGTSSKIENYLGFPTGISGQALAGRALSQAEKFGAEVAIARRAVRLDCDSRPYKVKLSNGEVVQSKTIVIATGARYRKPEIPDLPRFEGAGVFYSATHLEAQLCKDEEIAVVGGANSAGQAVVFLSQMAAKVHMLVRGRGLAESMSRYLIQRIEDSRNVNLRTRTQIEALEGTDALERVRWRQVETGDTELHAIKNVFMMTGAVPNTKWLEGCVLLDEKGFVKTGSDLRGEDLAAAGWRLPRAPYLMETSIPGVFAVGDARSGSVKRVASAVGEGSICVQLIHHALTEL
jgi:thioredoxin reductase (NADPH)